MDLLLPQGSREWWNSLGAKVVVTAYSDLHFSRPLSCPIPEVRSSMLSETRGF